MSNIALRVDHLSKLYRIGRAQQRHDTLRDVVSSVFSHQSSVFSRQSHPGTDNCELKTDNSLLWALRDVSFEVQRGGVVGTLAPALRSGASAGVPSLPLRAGFGRNGAGKSTLLKILSRITEPMGACRVVALAESASGKV